MSASDLYNQNKYLKSALFSEIPLGSTDPNPTFGHGCKVAQFLQSYKNALPESTRDVLQNHVKGSMKIAQTQTKGMLLNYLL